MTDVIAAEWHKLRALRSSRYLVVGVVVVALAAVALMIGLTYTWDHGSADLRAHFESVDPTIMVGPFAQFLVGALGALVITGEYGTGLIRTSLIAVPRRGVVLAAKLVVAGVVALVVGEVVFFAVVASSRWIIGGRPHPLQPWASAGQAWKVAVAGGVVVALVALVALGLGAVIRSVAGTLVALTGLLFVLPVVLTLMPWSGAQFLAATTPFYLAQELSHTGHPQLLSTTDCLIAIGVYLAGAIGAGAVVLHRRDA